MFHMMQIADDLGFTHFAGSVRRAEVFDIDALPTFVRHAGVRPLAAAVMRIPVMPDS
jgi:hypothetical protein